MARSKSKAKPARAQIDSLPKKMQDRATKLAPNPGDSESALHLVKLCVGCTDIADLAAWQKKRRAEAKRRYNIHVTRSFPRRADELLAGGSLYWVIQGRIRVRQRLIGIVPHAGKDGGEPRCELRLDPKLVEVAARHHRPFQGWRYLDAKDAPPDLGARAPRGDKLPPALEAELRALGLL